jgi:transcriptional regulator with GAF, ATPase, and Fis domain
MVDRSTGPLLPQKREPSASLSHDRLAALFHISLKLNQISDLQQLLDEILHLAVTNIGSERGLIILTDESGHDYKTVASAPLDEEDIAFSTSIVKETMTHKKTLMSTDLYSDTRFKNAESIEGLNILSFICVPLVVPGRAHALGTVYVDQRIDVKTFTNEDAAFLEAFANLAAIAISNANLMEQLVSENIVLRQEVGKRYEFPGIAGQSKAMQRVMQDMQRVLNDDCTVLITGETGTGKEVVAKAIHYNGNRSGKPFLAINCGAFSEGTLEVELFGSVKGAFTGALDKAGLFEAASRGTLLLDEVQHMSEAMQIKLLRVLQEKEIRRVGGTKNIVVDVRLICTTNEDLLKAIKDRRFRQDLYHRINVVTIAVPPLRERREDIPLLAQFFGDKYSKERGKNLAGITKEAMDALRSYDWADNNVRELENEIRRIVIYADDGEAIRLDHLKEEVRSLGSQLPVSAPESRSLAEMVEMVERQAIIHALEETGGNKSEAARVLGIYRGRLYQLMKKHGLM